MWASADLWELTDGTPESVTEWNKLCDPKELRNRILSGEKVLFATWNGIIVGFIAYRILDVAEALFVAQGYAANTTNEIAKQAKVPIGSLYQFFSDKKAIAQALTVRYNQLYHERVAFLNNAEIAKLPLCTYVELLLDTTTHFFDDYPGYHAIFTEVQGSVPEVQEIEDTADAKLMILEAKRLTLSYLQSYLPSS
jgi:Bacterial regulatory proteins, tetR family